MLSGLLRRYPVPAAYLAVLGVMYAVVAHSLSAADQRFFVGWASTNLANLASRPVMTLVVSAFVSQDTILLWIVVTSAGLVLLVRRFGNLRAALLIITAHVAGTLVSEGITAVRLSVGAAPQAMRHIIDVGPSYVTVSALVAVALFGQERRARVVALACWLGMAPFLFEGINDLDVAAVGHVVSILTGALVGGLFVHREAGNRRATGHRDALVSAVPPGSPVSPESGRWIRGLRERVPSRGERFSDNLHR
jgi:hypothetical protein